MRYNIVIIVVSVLSYMKYGDEYMRTRKRSDNKWLSEVLISSLVMKEDTKIDATLNNKKTEKKPKRI